MSVVPGQFAGYFVALYGYSPFPWQQRLLDTVVTEGWPKTLALPTASGKTACIDIALFALACGAVNAPRRIFFVVDRRVIVDEAFNRARAISKALMHPQSAILREVADALRGGQDSDPLAVFQLRGGVYRDDAWARTPVQPTVICSTVDQIGSRLLFRSYGANPYIWPLHAGLAANDSLILLDEAHCSNPFRQTLDAIERYRKWADQPVPTPFARVVLSATPGIFDEEPFLLQEDDHAHPVLSRRLIARKPARLVECKKEKTATKAFAAKLVGEAHLLATQGARRVGIIVNRVATARYVFGLLKTPVNRKALFIGRMRPLDRDELMRRWQPVFRAGSEEVVEEPCFVVATQCLEVGADLDFDALVTECASLDALRQRFGRLFRLGELSDPAQDVQSHQVATVLMPAADVRKGKHADEDPIYGPALAATWKWLNSKANDGVFDFGINAVDRHFPDDAKVRTVFLSDEQLLPWVPDAPVMLPAHVDCWVQTSPAPVPEPEPALFFHGPRNTPPDVQVCWRLDLDDAEPDDWLNIVALLPPASGECMSVPIHVVRRWLKGEDAGVIADVDTADQGDETDGIDSGRQVPPFVLVWRGEERSEVYAQSDDAVLRPGDTIVVPVSAGGWSVFGAILENEDGQPIQGDCGDEANLRARARAVIRMHPALLARFPEVEARSHLQALLGPRGVHEDFSTPEMKDELKLCLRSLAESLAVMPNPERRQWAWLHVAASHLAKGSFDIEAYPTKGLVLTGRRKLTSKEREGLQQTGAVDETDFSTEDDSASFTTQIKLPAHLAGVAKFARRFAIGCGLPKELVADIELAASLHDLGKADPRFQAWLRGGLPFPLAQQFADLLAKSGGPSNATARRRARERAGYPAGGRHELLSVRLVESDPDILSAANDPELVLHLIASHHGRCRPFAPVVDDSTPVEVSITVDGRALQCLSDTRLERLDSGIAERFWILVRRYGWWGLAYLEAIHVLADHRCSESELCNAGQAI